MNHQNHMGRLRMPDKTCPYPLADKGIFMFREVLLMALKKYETQNYV